MIKTAGIILLFALTLGNGVYFTSQQKAMGHVKNSSYDSLKTSIASLRNQIKKKYSIANDSIKNLILAQSKSIIEVSLLNQIIPTWYGTPWDFEGYTATPQKGKIACGYFVSTTLLHAGFKLNRYTLAQKNPFMEAKSYNFGSPVITYENLNKTAVIDSIMQNKFADGLYFVGLDFHVGYLWKTSGELFFIHSNYIEKAGVMREKALESEAFGGYSFYLVPLTPNPKMVEAWILHKEIKTLPSP